MMQWPAWKRICCLQYLDPGGETPELEGSANVLPEPAFWSFMQYMAQH